MSLKQLAMENRGVMLRVLADPTQERRFVISRSLAMHRATGSLDRRKAPAQFTKVPWEVGGT